MPSSSILPHPYISWWTTSLTTSLCPNKIQSSQLVLSLNWVLLQSILMISFFAPLIGLTSLLFLPYCSLTLNKAFSPWVAPTWSAFERLKLRQAPYKWSNTKQYKTFLLASHLHWIPQICFLLFFLWVHAREMGICLLVCSVCVPTALSACQPAPASSNSSANNLLHLFYFRNNYVLTSTSRWPNCFQSKRSPCFSHYSSTLAPSMPTSKQFPLPSQDMAPKA